MKNKKILAIFAMVISMSCLMTACGFGNDDAEDQVIVEATPTPEPEKEPEPTPTTVPADVQSNIYTSKDHMISIQLPDATWASKTDEEDMYGFESPDAGKILILHGAGEEDMSVAVIPSSQDMAVSLEQAADLVQGTDFEIQDYTATNVNGANVYSYTTHMLNTEKSGGYVYVINKVFSNDGEYYSIAASVKTDAAYAGMKAAVDSFAIVGESSLQAAAPQTAGIVPAADGAQPAADGTQQSADVQTDGTGSNSGGFTQEQLTDTNQTRTIYRNSDGQPLVITPDANGNWVDAAGNTYDFVNNEDVYDQNGVDFYYHGEAADVYYMPVE